MNLHDDDFSLFGLARVFVQDSAALEARWKDLQRQVHPDNFTSQGAAAMRVAMQWSVRINEAHQRLKDPMSRAAYLCELAGFPIHAHSNTSMPEDFLMQQLEWREALDAASDAADVGHLLQQVLQIRASLLLQCEILLDQTHDYPSAVGVVRALMFMDKFCQDLNRRLDQLE